MTATRWVSCGFHRGRLGVNVAVRPRRPSVSVEEENAETCHIRRAELREQETSMTVANDLAVRRALETAGIVFIDENGGGPGGRLNKQSREKLRKDD